MQNFYLTRCAYRRDHITPHGEIQQGQGRVAGDESTLGTIILRIEHAMIHDHIFYVGYWDRELACWRLNRHCCLLHDIAEEVTFRDEQPEDLAITACPRNEAGEHIRQTVHLEDAIERRRAARDERRVRRLGIRDRNALRGAKEGGEPKEKKAPKTIETEAMLLELDAQYEQEMEDNARKADDDDEDYSE